MKSNYVICLENKSYEVSLERRKIYRAVKDEQAAEVNQVRVIDESGEDYLYPSEYFMAIDLPKPVEKALAAAR